jgi:hypothetical protein
MSKEALLELMENLKFQYDSQVTSLESNKPPGNSGNNSGAVLTARPPKSARGGRKATAKQRAEFTDPNAVSSESSDTNLTSNNNDMNDPQQRLLKLEQMVVGGELSNNEELKKKRIKKKKEAEERKRLLAESLRNGNDDEFMLRVYDNVQEEVKYKTKELEKEKQRVLFLENEVKDLSHEFEIERTEYLDTIRKQEKQLKLIAKLNQKIHSFVPHDCNFYNLDKIQTISIWNEELQDWAVPDIKREKLSLPTMGSNNANSAGQATNGARANGGRNSVPNNGGSQDDLEFYNESLNVGFESEGAVPGGAMMGGAGAGGSYANAYVPQAQNALLQNRRNTLLSSNGDYDSQYGGRGGAEPEVDRLRMKLENSQYNGNNYFKNKRQSELLSQTQEMKNLGGGSNNRLSPMGGSNRGSNWKPYS